MNNKVKIWNDTLYWISTSFPFRSILVEVAAARGGEGGNCAARHLVLLSCTVPAPVYLYLYLTALYLCTCTYTCIPVTYCTGGHCTVQLQSITSRMPCRLQLQYLAVLYCNALQFLHLFAASRCTLFCSNTSQTFSSKHWSPQGWSDEDHYKDHEDHQDDDQMRALLMW